MSTDPREAARRLLIEREKRWASIRENDIQTVARALLAGPPPDVREALEQAKIEKTKLEPCPFCGAAEEYPQTGRMKGPTIGASQEMDDAGNYIDEERTWGVCCGTCGSSTGGLDTEIKAIAAWNRHTLLAGPSPAAREALQQAEEIAWDVAARELEKFDGGEQTYGHHAAEEIAKTIRALPRAAVPHTKIVARALLAGPSSDVRKALEIASLYIDPMDCKDEDWAKIQVALSPPEPAMIASHVDVVFDGPPNANGGAFVEVEDAEGHSVEFGEWLERSDGYWVLRIPVLVARKQ